jgi:hypothetical protein
MFYHTMIHQTLNLKKKINMDIGVLKSKGVKKVYLNGFIESVGYVYGLGRELKYCGETKSEDGYNMIHCYETID